METEQLGLLLDHPPPSLDGLPVRVRAWRGRNRYLRETAWTYSLTMADHPAIAREPVTVAMPAGWNVKRRTDGERLLVDPNGTVWLLCAVLGGGIGAIV